jgi:SAM-dependent methyltransferase
MDQDFYREYYELEDRHWWFVGRREVFLRVLDRHFGPRTSAAGRVLDVGCGTGTMLGHLSRYGTVQGVDASEEAVRFCRERGVEGVVQADGVPLPFDSASFDLVTALDVIEHADADVELLAELRRVARPGGTLLVSVPAYRFLWGPQDEISHHKRRYTARLLRLRIADAGWTLERLSYFNTLLFPPIAAVRLLRRDRGDDPPRSDFELTKPGRLNALLARTFSLEAPLVERFDLPFGVSILALARRAG